MSRSARLLTLFAALLLLGAACGDDAAVDEPAEEGDDVEESLDEADDGSADESDDEAADESDDETGDGDEHAEATFNGEPIAFHGVTCGTLPTGDLYEIRGRIEGGGDLQARFAMDTDAGGDDIVLDSETPTRISLFFSGEGGTIGDGEGFDARGDDLAGLDASVTHVRGTVDLEPNTDTRSPETTPDGGTVEFELICG